MATVNVSEVQIDYVERVVRILFRKHSTYNRTPFTDVEAAVGMWRYAMAEQHPLVLKAYDAMLAAVGEGPFEGTVAERFIRIDPNPTAGCGMLGNVAVYFKFPFRVPDTYRHELNIDATNPYAHLLLPMVAELRRACMPSRYGPRIVVNFLRKRNTFAMVRRDWPELIHYMDKERQDKLGHSCSRGKQIRHEGEGLEDEAYWIPVVNQWLAVAALMPTPEVGNLRDCLHVC